jgi:Xaa-Pro aminopeptidase
MSESLTEELGRACGTAREAGADAVILGSIHNVTYVTQIEVPIPFGAMAALTYGPWLAIIDAREETGWLVAPNFAAASIEERAAGFTPVPFETFDSFAPTDPAGTYRSAIEQALRFVGIENRAITVAIEAQYAPSVALELVQRQAPNAKVVDATPLLQQARLIKTDGEIANLRAASHLADIAHNTLAELSNEAGRNEIEMWAEIGAAVNMAAGRGTPLTGELVTGPRSSVVLYPNGPVDRTTEPGDAVLMDLSARLDGYWFDCTNTYIVGGYDPTTEQRRFAKASQDACEAAMAALKPGARASDAAEAASKAFERHGLPMAHYSGHQIGVSVNELPRLVTYDHTVIEAGMVFSVEPGAYQGPDGTFGSRSEKMVLVKPDGPEILSTFSWGIA